MLLVTKKITSLVIMFAVIIAVFVFGMRGCLAIYDERSALPPVLYFKNDSSTILFSLVKYSKTTSYSRKGGLVNKTVSNHYLIQCNDAISGHKILSKEIENDVTVKHFPEIILGAGGNHAWVFLNELLAFNAFTLEKVADVKMIEAKNTSLKGMMPKEGHYYRFDKESNSVIFTANDGVQWMLHSKTLTAIPYTTPTTPDNKSDKERLAKKLQDYLQHLQQLSLHFTQLKINQDTINGKWIGFYAKEEIESLNPVVSVAYAGKQEQRRQIYTASYNAVSEDKFVIVKPVLPRGTTSAFYLDAGFLVNKETGKPFYFTDASYLMVYKTAIGETGKIVVARMLPDGTMVWQFDTELTKWIDWKYKDNRLIIFGNDNRQLNNRECNIVFSVDLNSGIANNYDYFKDEARK